MVTAPGHGDANGLHRWGQDFARCGEEVRPCDREFEMDQARQKEVIIYILYNIYLIYHIKGCNGPFLGRSSRPMAVNAQVQFQGLP